MLFDEMKLRTEYQYDQTKDCVMKPYYYVQVVLIKGIQEEWNQPVFNDFDCEITAHILKDVIKFVEDSGKFNCSDVI